MSLENIITINGNEFSFEEGETILQVARRNGIEIPTLCYLKGGTPTGSCRICLVEVEGARTLVSSCSAPAAPNMVVRTESRRVIEARRLNLELLISSGSHNCLVQGLDMDSWTDFQLQAMEPDEHKTLCPAYGKCELQDLAIRYRVKINRFPPSKAFQQIENVNPFIVRDLTRCILCGKCVQACNDIQVNNAISFGYRGSESKIVTKGDHPLKDSDCVFCGECVQACPVGALITKDDFLSSGLDQDVKKVRTTCSYCGVGCQLYLHAKENRIVKVTGVEETPPNFGSLCVKGRFGYSFINDEGRLKTPLIKENGSFREGTWDEALDLVVEKLTQIKKESGPDSIATLCSARITNEENYLAQKFTRAVLGTNNVDHCARL
jgi:predicted molibdopterin-dependent oxidoreductase YjgC